MPKPSCPGDSCAVISMGHEFSGPMEIRKQLVSFCGLCKITTNHVKNFSHQAFLDEGLPVEPSLLINFLIPTVLSSGRRTRSWATPLGGSFFLWRQPPTTDLQGKWIPITYVILSARPSGYLAAQYAIGEIPLG